MLLISNRTNSYNKYLLPVQDIQGEILSLLCFFSHFLVFPVCIVNSLSPHSGNYPSPIRKKQFNFAKIVIAGVMNGIIFNFTLL